MTRKILFQFLQIKIRALVSTKEFLKFLNLRSLFFNYFTNKDFDQFDSNQATKGSRINK